MKTVLVVDDEPKITDLYLRLLQPVGLNVLCANTAEKAGFTIFRDKVDLVLLDINMPSIDGRTVYEVIREFDRNMKVIVTSVYSIKRQKELIPHALDYYDKSEGAMALLAKVKTALGQGEG